MCTRNEHYNYTIFKNPLTIILKKNKIHINLTKEVQNLYNENFKEIQKDLNIWKETESSWTKKIVKMVIFSKLIYKFNMSPIKISVIVFPRNWPAVSKILWKSKGFSIDKTTLIKKNKVGVPILSNFKIFYKAL